MKLNLKNARRLESVIQTELAITNLPHNQRWKTRSEAISSINDDFKKVHRKLMSLIHAKFVIRLLIQEANHASGINSSVTSLAEMTEMRESLSNLSDATLLNFVTNSYNGDSYTGKITPEIQEELRYSIREMDRQIQSLKDSCGGINASHFVEIPEPVVGTLREYRLISDDKENLV